MDFNDTKEREKLLRSILKEHFDEKKLGIFLLNALTPRCIMNYVLYIINNPHRAFLYLNKITKRVSHQSTLSKLEINEEINKEKNNSQSLDSFYSQKHSVDSFNNHPELLFNMEPCLKNIIYSADKLHEQTNSNMLEREQIYLRPFRFANRETILKNIKKKNGISSDGEINKGKDFSGPMDIDDLSHSINSKVKQIESIVRDTDASYVENDVDGTFDINGKSETKQLDLIDEIGLFFMEFVFSENRFVLYESKNTDSVSYHINFKNGSYLSCPLEMLLKNDSEIYKLINDIIDENKSFIRTRRESVSSFILESPVGKKFVDVFLDRYFFIITYLMFLFDTLRITSMRENCLFVDINNSNNNDNKQNEIPNIMESRLFENWITQCMYYLIFVSSRYMKMTAKEFIDLCNKKKKKDVKQALLELEHYNYPTEEKIIFLTIWIFHHRNELRNKNVCTSFATHYLYYENYIKHKYEVFSKIFLEQ